MDEIIELFKKVVAIEYQDMDDEDLELFYNEAILEVDQTRFGRFYPRSVALMMAHLIALTNKAKTIGMNNQSGQIKKVTVGDLSREYAVAETSNFGDGDLASTIYGAEFLRLRKRILFTPVYIA